MGSVGFRYMILKDYIIIGISLAIYIIGYITAIAVLKEKMKQTEKETDQNKKDINQLGKKVDEAIHDHSLCTYKADKIHYSNLFDSIKINNVKTLSRIEKIVDRVELKVDNLNSIVLEVKAWREQQNE